MGNYQVADRGDLRKYRTEIPNSIDDMDLSVYAFRLYVHLKRVAGDSGKCWQSSDTLATACHMSKGMISKAKDELVDKGLIHIDEQKLERGGRAAHHVTVNDIWLENFIKFAGHQPSSQDEQASSYSELPSSPHEQASSPHEIKKEPLSNKKEHIKNTRGGKPPAPRDPLLDNPAIIEYRSKAKIQIPAVLRKEVADTVTDIPLWGTIIYDWIGNGWNKQNVRGMLDAYRKGGIQSKNGSGKQDQSMADFIRSL